MAKKKFVGRDVKKTFTVLTNNKNRPEFELVMTGHVGRLANIQPTRVLLTGRAGQSISQTVTIIPETDPPFHIVDTRTLEGTHLSHRLEKTKISGKRAYRMVVKNRMKQPGRYFDRIFIQTDRSDDSEFTIPVTGHILPKN